MTDITDLKNKTNNQEQTEASASVPANEKLTAQEFVNKIVEPIIELQNDVQHNVVRVIKFNGQTIQLKDGGVAEFAQSGSVDTYGIVVASQVDNDKERVLKKGSTFPVNLRYSAIKISTIGETSVYRDVPATMTITRQMQGSTLVETVYTERGINAIDRNSTDWNVSISDLAQYCRTGAQNIKITFSTSYTQSGVTQSIEGSVVFQVRVIDLSVTSLQDYVNPLDGSNGSLPSIKFNISGNVQKFLHISITGSTQVGEYSNVIELDSSEGQYNLPSIQDTALIGLTNHGVHTIKAWLTCDDGSNSVGTDQFPNGITSDVCTLRVMVVNSSKATQADIDKVYLLMQETVTTADNYTQVHLTDFAIWKSNPTNIIGADLGTHNIRVLVSDFNQDNTYGEINFIGVKCLETYKADCMVEIESSDESITQFSAYMRIFRELANGTEDNMIVSSGILSSAFVGFTVRNSADYAPTAGATFYLNPKSRSNNEEEWNKIKNSRNNNAVVDTISDVSRTHSMWQKDSDGIGILRILAGEQMEITGAAADAFSRLRDNGKSDLTIEIDYKVRNVTNLDDPIISIVENFQDQKLGVEIRPQEVHMICKGKQDLENEKYQTVGVRENTRTNLIFTLNHQVDPTDTDLARYDFSTIDPQFAYNTLSLARIYVNGKCNNAFVYSTENKTWQNTEGATRFIIGQAGSDIDIYGIRIYPEALTSQQIKQNIVASKTTSAEKDKVVAENKIVDARGMVKKNLVENNLRRNTFTLHCEQEQWKGVESAKQSCYIEMHIFDPNTGEELLERGGIIGKYAYEAYKAGKLNGKKCMTWKSQGSTANTYAFHNGQGKTTDITYPITISIKLLHSDFGWNPNDGKYPIFYNDTELTPTEYAALAEEQKAECMITVIDGWFDWNGMYHGQFWKPSANGAKAEKLCNKINYASTMVSHKMGMTSLYNDVQRIILADINMLPKSHSSNTSARFAVEELPFFYFQQSNENDDAVFHGFSTFGSAKADKPTWGYSKSKYAKMCMFEGADNNVPLADFRIPFDDDVHGYYDADKGDWSWAITNNTNNKANELQLDFDLGIKAGDSDDTLTEPLDTDAPSADITSHLKTFCNLFYCHNTRLNYYDGSIAQFRTYYNSLDILEKREIETKTFWMTADFCLYRFNYTTLEWVNAGTWTDGVGGTGFYTAGVRNLSTDGMTSAAYDTWVDGGTHDYAQLNLLFRQAIASHFVSIAKDYISEDSFLTHYNLINSMGAGTDNCSKNTYFVLCLVTINSQDVWRWYWFTDDVDTIFKTDNNGGQTKRWWIFRMSDIDDVNNGYKPSTDYEGNGSVMFNLCEDAYDDNLTRKDGVSGTRDTKLQINMKKVLNAMKSLVSSSDSIAGYTAESSLMACWHKYFLQYSEYFPIVAFNETGRIRYEYPEAWGYRSRGKGARNIAPITQHLGDQREAEIDFLEKRTVLYAQYAAWGDAAAVTGSIGVADASNQVSAKGSSSLGQLIFNFTLKSDRPFYATGSSGNSVINNHVRVMPGQTYQLSISTDGDQGCGLCCSNYYTEFGNFASARVSSQAITIYGSRLRKLELSTTDQLAMAPSNLELKCTSIEKFVMKCPGYKGTMDLSECLRLKSADITTSAITAFNIPEDTKLETLKLNDKVAEVKVVDMKYLTTFSLENYAKVVSVTVSGCPNLDTQSIMSALYTSKQQNGAEPLTYLKMTDVLWGSTSDNTGVSSNVLDYILTITNVSLTGYINIPTTSPVTSSTKINLLNTFGDIDSSSNPLYITYRARNILSLGIDGKICIRRTGQYPYSLIFNPTEANNFKQIKWSIEDNPYATINEDTGVLTVTEVVSEEFAQPKAKVTCTVTLISGSTVSTDMTLYLYNRVPKVGDFAYADGEFGSVLYPNKAVIGWVYKVTNNNDGTYECLIQSAEQSIRLTSSDGTTLDTTSVPWGIYDYNDADSIPRAEVEEIATAIYAASRTAVGDIPEVPNLTGQGISGDYANHTNVYDLNTADGFKEFASNTGQSDWAGKQKTAAIIAHAKKILSLYGEEMIDADGNTLQTLTGKTDIIPTTLTELADILVALEKIGGALKYRQLAYPAAFACSLYQPSAQGLHEQYTKGNWYLPAEGDLLRLYIFHRNSKTADPLVSSTTADSSNSTPNVDYANEHPSAEALTPAYSNLLKRSADAGVQCPVALSSQSYTWSSTEYYSTDSWGVNFGTGYVNGTYVKSVSLVVRPVTAFTFEL